MRRLELTAEDMADLIAGHTINVMLDSGEEVIAAAPDGVNENWDSDDPHDADGNRLTPADTVSGPDYSNVPEFQFPQNEEEARLCEHGNLVWFGHECGLCEDNGGYRWHDDRECVRVSIGTEAEVGEWFRCTTHHYDMLGDASVCEGYTPPPYVDPATVSRVHFQPEAWVDDNAIPVDDEGPDTWNVTAETARHIPIALKRGSDLDFVRDDANAPDWVANWLGPFTITVVES